MNTTTQVRPHLAIRRAAERGQTQFGWLNSYHSFSFGEYFDAAHMGFRSLRVINDDYIAPGGGFPLHPHRDMEIVTYVISGQLQHRDSMGNGSVVRAGEVQKMSAGRGIMHSEFNPSSTEALRLLQIWIQPAERGIAPGYAEWKPTEKKGNGLTLIAAPPGESGVPMHQDARIYFGDLQPDAEIVHRTSPERGLWLQMIEGEVEAFGETLHEGDALTIENAEALTLRATNAAGGRFLLFDLA